MKSSYAVSLLFSGVLAAQTLGIGVKGGVRLTDDLDSYWATSESRPYVVGAMATVALPHRFEVEVDALYRRVGYRTRDLGAFGESYIEQIRGNTWEFPVILRRTLGRGIFAGVGYAPRTFSGSGRYNAMGYTSMNPPVLEHREGSVPAEWRSTQGVVAVAGFEKRAGRFRIAPEVRYIHWNRPAVDRSGTRGFMIQSTQDQVDVLIGIRFP